MAEEQERQSARLTEPPLKLLAQALGDPAAIAGKARRFAEIVRNYGSGAVLDKKLARLLARGHIERAATRTQLAVGAYDMLRFWISPAAADYYQAKQISYVFHQVLRFCDEPASLLDPIGFFSTRDGIIGHLMQVVHANPVYDLQLLDLFDDGLDQLEVQLSQMIRGTHPRAQSIGAIVEESAYHRELLEFVMAWRSDPTIAPLLRSNVRERRELALLERTFGSLTCAMAYFCEMPTAPHRALAHATMTHEFSEHLAQRALARVHNWRQQASAP
jgi:hypothetical protein